LRGSPRLISRPEVSSHRQQAKRFGKKFNQLDVALSNEDQFIELRQDPFGIAPERALVFVTAVPISNFVQAAKRANLEVLSEFELGDGYELPEGLISQNQDKVNPTLYASMPTLETLRLLLRLWRRYEKGKSARRGDTPWWNLFDMLAELRAWGPKDRLTVESGQELENRLPLNETEEVRIELEYWPNHGEASPIQWRKNTEIKIVEIGGRIIDRSSIHEGNFHYEALLVGLSSGYVRQMIREPSAPESLATFEGLQFILPQTIAQSMPSQSPPMEISSNDLEDFEDDVAFRVLLLDGTPIARHPALDGGVVIEDVHDLVERSVVSTRRHATEMASLILRGDLISDGEPLRNSRVLAIPLLIDMENESTAPNDRLFIDLVHVALQRAFESATPLAPDVFVVNFSIGVRGGNFAGQISSLARLLDWWSYKTGVAFVVSAGNIQDDLEIADTNTTAFESLSVSDRQNLVHGAQRLQRYKRTLLSPSEALNVLTIGAASIDPIPSVRSPIHRAIEISEEAGISPAISSATGLGPFRSIKPDLIATGGKHEVKSLSKSDSINLRLVQNTEQTGLAVAGVMRGHVVCSRSRGTSCAAALVTRSMVNAASALTEEGGPYEGQELSSSDLALLTRALAVNGAKWPETAEEFYRAERERLGARRHHQAMEEVARYFGYGFLDPELMYEAPLYGATLVGLGYVRKDGGAIFDMPLPSCLMKDEIDRSMLVTLAWFSPVEPARAKYRLSALEAIAADGSMQEDADKDDEWKIGVKSVPPSGYLISRGTVWSRRFVHKRKRVSDFSEDAVLPIRVQCRETSGGSLSPDEEIKFAIVVTLQLATTVRYDIYKEIRDRLLIRVPTHG